MVAHYEVPEDLIEQEKAVAREEAKNAGRPEQAWPKIVEGRLENFFKETVLLEQPYIRDPKTSIDQLVKQSIAKLQENITVRRFARFNVKEA